MSISDELQKILGRVHSEPGRGRALRWLMSAEHVRECGTLLAGRSPRWKRLTRGPASDNLLLDDIPVVIDPGRASPRLIVEQAVDADQPERLPRPAAAKTDPPGEWVDGAGRRHFRFDREAMLGDTVWTAEGRGGVVDEIRLSRSGVRYLTRYQLSDGSWRTDEVEHAAVVKNEGFSEADR